MQVRFPLMFFRGDPKSAPISYVYLYKSIAYQFIWSSIPAPGTIFSKLLCPSDFHLYLNLTNRHGPVQANSRRPWRSPYGRTEVRLKLLQAVLSIPAPGTIFSKLLCPSDFPIYLNLTNRHGSVQANARRPWHLPYGQQ